MRRRTARLLELDDLTNMLRQPVELAQGYMMRQKVNPGIMGLAQVLGYRGETRTPDVMEKRVEYDLEYLRNWSLALDLRIMLRTMRIVVGDKMAY